MENESTIEVDDDDIVSIPHNDYEDLDSDKVSLQSTQKSNLPPSLEKRVFGERVYQAFKPYIYFMSPLLRFPIKQKINPDGKFVFYYAASSVLSVGFIFTSVLVGIITLLSCVNIIGTILDAPPIQPHQGVLRSSEVSKLRFEERYIMRRNMIPIIILVTCLFHAAVASWQFYRKRYFIASYLSFWTEAVEITRIDAAYNLKRYMTLIMSCYGGFLIAFVILCAIRIAPVSSGGPAVLSMLTLRCFYPTIHASEYFWIVRGIGSILFLYIMICSKAFMFGFILVCHLLKNSFLVWNHRLDRVLHRGEGNQSRTIKVAQRTGYDHLFKDHVCLLDLLEGADTMFSNIIESYYASHVISLAFEVYYLYRSQSKPEEFKGARRLDGVIIFMYLVHTFVILYLVSMIGSEVGEEAMDGLEILRRKGMMGKKTDDELYFMISMYTSYTGHYDTAIAGGRYFTLDKGFLIGIAGSVFSYLIIILQFSPALVLEGPGSLSGNNSGDQEKVSKLLDHVEGTYQYFGLPTGFLTFNNYSSMSVSHGNLTY